MKKIAIVLLASTQALMAQKTDKVSVDFEMELYPRNLITKEKNIEIVTSSNYKDVIDQRKAEADKMREEQAKKSTGKKMFEKALSKTVFDPNDPKPENIFIPTLIGDETSALINVPGYTKSNTGKGKIKVVFYPMEISKMEAAQFYYSPLKADVTIINDKGETIYGGSFGAIKGAYTYAITSSEKLEDSYKKAEAKAKEETLRQINLFLKDEYGYLKMKDDRSFFDIKDKKHTYPEYHTALEKVRSAFPFANVPSKKAAFESSLKEAIALWEESLTHLDKTNKDAKINKEVAAITYLNIAEANIWLNQFDKAKEALGGYKALDEDYNKAYNKVNTFSDDYAKRYNAFVSY